MNNVEAAHDENEESSLNTLELLSSLFEDSKESKIRHVKKKTRLKSAVKKNSTDIRLKKDLQQQTPKDRRGRKTRLSGSEMKARSTKKKTQVRKPVVAEVVTAEEAGIKAHVQEKRLKTVTEKRSAPVIRKREEKRISENSMVNKEERAASEVCVRPPEAGYYPQRRSIFGSTILGIGLPFAMGVLLTLLGTRYVSLDFFNDDRGIVLAKNKMTEDPAPKKQDVTILTASAATVDTRKQEYASKITEPPPIGPEKETIGGSTSKKPDTPVTETPRKTIASAKKEVTSTSFEISKSTHSGEAARTETFQRDGIKSYPYSVYFGSYKRVDSAQEVISGCQEKGLSPYWVKVDLGEKGVWYRVLAGHFQTKDEVKTYIEKNQITEGESMHVPYANLIGHYHSDEELREKKLSLSELGYSPYVITEDDGESLLLTGAFYNKADVEKEHIELASKGIQAQVVRR